MQPKMAFRSLQALTGAVIPLRIIDVGANLIEGNPAYAALIAEGAEVLGFEPNPFALNQLLAQKTERETYLPHAIGDGEVHTLSICSAPGMTSLLTPNQTILSRFQGFAEWGRVVETKEVRTVRLDDIPEARGMDMLKIDIQGGELMAMQHGEIMLRDVSVIQTEVEFLPLYVDQPLFSDVDQFLRQQGFMLHRFFPTVSRAMCPVTVNNDVTAEFSQLVWGDAIYIRDFTRMEMMSDHQLIATAALLHGCYGSVDVAFNFLLEHDKRTGGALAGVYLGGLQDGLSLAA